MEKKVIQNKNYNNFLYEIKERIQKARYKALQSVNKEQISLYWDIGKMISEKQTRLGWGKSVVEQLSKDLQREFIPEYAGKMQFYLSVLNDKVKKEYEKPAIGIIICKSKKRTVVEYALNSSFGGLER
jgi:predicted nuclease of restriction endonuclease-like (RecB) superfamily